MVTPLRRALQAVGLLAAPASAVTPQSLARDFARTLIGPTQSVDASANGPTRVRGNLEEYFSAHHTGPGIWKWLHYFDMYEKHLAKFVGRAVHVVEIGVYSGGSLEMWRRYFGADCRVTGVDIEPACKRHENEFTTIVIGDQADREFWMRFRKTAAPVDVLIDDGGHTFEQQRVTFEEILPLLTPGGVYICEDMHATNNPFANYLHTLADELNDFGEQSTAGVLGTRANPVQQTIASLHFYPFAAVLEKNERVVEGFSAPKQGTQWEPFL